MLSWFTAGGTFSRRGRAQRLSRCRADSHPEVKSWPLGWHHPGDRMSRLALCFRKVQDWARQRCLHRPRYVEERQTLTLAVWCGTFKRSDHMLATQTVDSARSRSSASPGTRTNDALPLWANYSRACARLVCFSSPCLHFSFSVRWHHRTARAWYAGRCAITPLWVER